MRNVYAPRGRNPRGAYVFYGTRYWAFPEPAQLAPASPRELYALLKNERKAEYLRAGIDAFQTVDEEFLRSGDYDAVRGWLLGIKGIGDDA